MAIACKSVGSCVQFEGCWSVTSVGEDVKLSGNDRFGLGLDLNSTWKVDEFLLGL